jgi:hypothetical protein
MQQGGVLRCGHLKRDAIYKMQRTEEKHWDACDHFHGGQHFILILRARIIGSNKEIQQYTMNSRTHFV